MVGQALASAPFVNLAVKSANGLTANRSQLGSGSRSMQAAIALARLLSGVNRRADDLLHDLGNALPYADSERRWLLHIGLHATNLSPAMLHADQPGFLDSVAEEKATLVVEGVARPVSGRSLLERQWMWRRETGIYAGGEGLSQAKVALAGLVNLLRPTLEEPAELARLSGQDVPS